MVESNNKPTKQGQNADSHGGDGAPGRLAVVSEIIVDHFRHRWGQGAPVTDAEAYLLGGQILDQLFGEHRR